MVEDQFRYLCPLHHLFVEIIRKSSHGEKLPRALSAREHAILVDQVAAANGDQGYAMTAQTLVQVYVSSLDLVINRDGP